MSYRVGDTPVSDTEALTAACPECDAEPGAPCVYPWPRAVTRDGHHNASVQARIDLVGTPTKRCHNGRRRAAAAARKPVKAKPTHVRVSLNEEHLRAILAGRIRQGLRNDLEHALWRLTGELIDTTPKQEAPPAPLDPHGGFGCSVYCKIHRYWDYAAGRTRYPGTFNILTSTHGWLNVKVHNGPEAYLPKKAKTEE